MKKSNIGLLFITPWLIGLLIFTIYPFVSSFILSFTDYNIVSSPNFVGLDNYKNLFKDATFLKSMNKTFLFAAIEVPLKLTFALLIAFILNFKLKGINFYRTAFYIPSILGGNVAIAVLWKFLFSESGLVNQVLAFVGIPTVGWFTSATGAMITLCLLRVWQFGSAMIIFLAALREIPADLYEAADIDGASKIKQFFKVTIPMLTPTIFFNLIMQLVQGLQEFNGPYLITAGGPLKSTYLMAMNIYDNAFKFFKMGYASAMSWILFIVIMFFTAIVFKSSKYWVFYSDGGEE